MKQITAVVAAAALIVAVFVAAGNEPAGSTINGAQPPPLRLSTSAVHEGVRITLSLPSRIYPRNALVEASVRVQNISNHEISAPGTSCTQTNPYVDDFSSTGKNLYPGRFGWFNLLPFCGATTEDTFMPPGYDSTYRVITVALGPNLRASMELRPANMTESVVQTYPRLHIRLGHSNPPRVDITSRNGNLSAVPRIPSRSSLEYVSLSHCYRGNAPYDYLGVYWSMTSTPTIPSECADTPTWHLLVGTFGRSLAIVNYRNPKAKLPTY